MINKVSVYGYLSHSPGMDSFKSAEGRGTKKNIRSILKPFACDNQLVFRQNRLERLDQHRFGKRDF